MSDEAEYPEVHHQRTVHWWSHDGVHWKREELPVEDAASRVEDEPSDG